MSKAKLSSKYQLVIPKEIRKRMSLVAGMHVGVIAIDENRALLVKRPRDYVDALQGLGKDLWKKLGGADAYIKNERASWEK